MEDAIREFTSGQDEIFRVVLSLPDRGTDVPARFLLEKVQGKEGDFWQSEQTEKAKVIRKTVPDPAAFLRENAPLYRQTDLFSPGVQVSYRRSKKGKVTRLVNKSSAARARGAHDREKAALIREGDRAPFLVDLGIFTKEYKVVRSMNDKFRQINRYLELLDDALKHFPKEEISILDFGCGKSYLTFLVYYYFSVLKKKRVTVLGYDLKEDVVARCNELAKAYGYHGMEFIVADVSRDVLTDRPVDLVITLHACDTATDYALFYAMKREIPYLFSVPCCQHEVNRTIQRGGGDLDLLLGHGLFKERTSALLTDAFRARILESRGYRVDVLEFVDFSHSPKNLMLRAKKTGKGGALPAELFELERRYGFRQTLLHLMEEEYGTKRGT